MSRSDPDSRPRVVGLEVESDRVVAREGGFLAVRRIELRNRYADGGLSQRYLCDFVVRPLGIDAVVVAVYRRDGDRVKVLIRNGLRPALALGRPADQLPIADRGPYLFLPELVAGVVEGQDRGEAGLRHRAAEEVAEEAGFEVDPSSVVLLGAGTFPSPGSMAEKFWLAAVEISDPAAQEPPAGDGSPMEEGVTTRWLDLDQAIAAGVAGELEDAKTELTLRRLRDYLRTQTHSPT